MRSSILRLPMMAALACATMLTPAAPAFAQSAASAAAVTPSAEIGALVERLQIPYERFTLDNGLTVIVHTDRKAPVVAVSVWYDVGSKHEPAGSTGFAHLFEHIMFNGSENAPGDYFTWMQEIGATDLNGTTNFDRTNYFQTVPTGALERTLFLESDRMGRLLGAVTQEKLDNQRGVVQNEKRQGDNQPFGLLRYYIFENLVPRGHPYYHSTIGSMADLNAASLDTVQNWFRANYGPNNAVIVLAGDVDVATARPMVERWFGSIPRGPEVVHPTVEIPTLPAPLAREVTDQIATTRLFRMWAIPGWGNEETPTLQVAASVLGGLSSSRLDNILVRGEQLAVSVSAGAQPFEDMGIFIVSADVRPGVDPATVGARLDAVIADFLRDGPTEDEVRRAVMSGLSGQLDGLESVGGFGGKAVALAQSELYTGDPGFWRRQIDRFASATPDQVREITGRWLSRPVFSLTYRPGPRTDTGDGRGGAVADPPASAAAGNLIGASYYRSPVSATEVAMGTSGGLVGFTAAQTGAAAASAPAAPAARIEPPALQPLGSLDFPDIERATLSNGIRVHFARRTAVPIVRATISFDAGAAADPRDRMGTQAMTLNLMTEGTTSLDATALAEAQERIGAGISVGFDSDRTNVSLYAPTVTMSQAFDLFADVVRNPAFAPAEIERLRNQQLTGIAAELNNPNALANRAVNPALYGSAHPYGGIAGNGTVSSVRAITRDDLTGFHQRWIRPDNATIFVVGDTSLAEVTRQLERSFGNWQAPAVARGSKDFSVAIPVPTPRILLVNRPNSPQSVIVAAQVLEARGRDDLTVLQQANDVLGGNFLSRINMNLRETKGWSYGSRSVVGGQEERVLFRVIAPVQADKTADAVREIQSDVNAFLGTNGVTAEELARTVNGAVRELPGSFEASDAVLGGIQQIVELGRPDDYYEQLPERYRAMTAASMDAALRAQIDPAKFTYIIVGDASIVTPQLDGLGLPVETVEPATLGGQ
jgi:predicted Zn-dependent peptidase